MVNKLNPAKEELFSRCEFIISWHFWFNRFPEWVSWTSEYISIKQKLKSKCYLWIRKVEKKWISFKSINMYDWKDIINFELIKFKKQYGKAIKYLENKLNLSDSRCWYEITVLSECMRWEWVGFTGTMMSLLVSWIYYLKWDLTSKMLGDYQKFQNSGLFKNISDLAHEATILSINWNIWSSFFSVLTEGSHPYVYITDNKDQSDYNKVENSTEYGKQLTDFFEVDDFPIETLPICWAMIYTWQKSDSTFAAWDRKFLKYSNLEYQKWFDKLEIWNMDTSLKDWLKSSDYFQTKLMNLNNKSINLLYLMENIYKKWAQNIYIHGLIKLMNLINTLCSDIEQDYDITNDFQLACIRNWVSLDTFWFSPIFTNKYGWDYLVVFEDDSDLDILETVVDSMKNIYPDIKIRETYDFNMPAKDGIVVEQDLNHWIWQELSWDLYVLVDNQWNQKFVQYTDINPKNEGWIFFDAVKNKIYVNGKVLTSKDIKSATTTIEIFDHLLRSANHSIENNELWPSSFSGQQNQMESKIINPLVKYIKKSLWKELPIESSGSLREFFITLWKTDISIQLVKKY